MKKIEKEISSIGKKIIPFIRKTVESEKKTDAKKMFFHPKQLKNLTK